MNIHFQDKELFQVLKDNSLVSSVVGSCLYGTNDELSDKDILYIYPTYDQSTFFPSHHQLQYKENGVDYIFTSIHQFIKNILSGDSTINFEVLQSGNLEGTCLDFLHQYKDDFRNYKLIKSYLGLARRDLKMLGQFQGREKTKKLSHIIRGYHYAEMLYKNEQFQLKNYEWLYCLIGIEDYEYSIFLKDHYSDRIETLRKLLNNGNKLDIPKFMKPSIQKEIDKCYSEIDDHILDNMLNNINYHREKIMDLFYNANENGVDYD